MPLSRYVWTPATSRSMQRMNPLYFSLRFCGREGLQVLRACESCLIWRFQTVSLRHYGTCHSLSFMRAGNIDKLIQQSSMSSCPSRPTKNFTDLNTLYLGWHRFGEKKLMSLKTELWISKDKEITEDTGNWKPEEVAHGDFVLTLTKDFLRQHTQACAGAPQSASGLNSDRDLFQMRLFRARWEIQVLQFSIMKQILVRIGKSTSHWMYTTRCEQCLIKSVPRAWDWHLKFVLQKLQF